ncbi:SMI1/KNR4 family protein [Streptomyces sp. NPDC051976]|uniref:SMI1/KNR4 family protein n=1 Tax=Streptomyces sp. NPDC051976 TaxID=3154947 RepID=UPI003423FE11
MTSSASLTWSRIHRVLQEHAPVTAASLRPPATTAAVAEAERAMMLEVPADVGEWLLLVDGAVPASGAGVLLPPLFVPVGLQRMVELRRMKLEIYGGQDGEQGFAGESRQEFSSAFFPVGDDTTGDLLVVDTRPGGAQGCVMSWSKSEGIYGAPIWANTGQMWEDVADALETGQQEGDDGSGDPHLTRNGCAAVFSVTGSVMWEF